MSPNGKGALDSEIAAKELIRNLEKLRQSKLSYSEDDNHLLTNGLDGSVEVNHFSTQKGTEPFKRKIAWELTWKLILGHAMAAWALYPLFFQISWAQVVYLIVLCLMVNGIGAVMAAHRYYSHRTFKANIPLQIIMIIFQTMATQGSVWYWTRNHRQHHKYSDTDADPHSAARGFFFSHIGWACTTKHPLVIEKSKEINVSDIDADPIAAFQRKHYFKMMFFFGFFVPLLIPVYVFGDTWWNSFLISVWLRMFLVNHATFSINSWAHHFGSKPYDKSIRPVETMFVAIVACGDGWHNFHHVFPQDYQASEYGAPFNLAARLIEFFAWIGWATDLKTVTPEMIAARIARTGDHTLLRNQPVLST